MVMSLAPVPARCARAVPIAIANWTAIGDVIGTTFQVRTEKCPAKLRPLDYGSVAAFRIWRIESMGSAPIASRVPPDR